MILLVEMNFTNCLRVVFWYLKRSKVLIHLFTDGMDNGSEKEDVEKYQGNVVQEREKGTKGEESLRQSFLYSLDSGFEQSSALAKSLQAHLVVIREEDLASALEERDKWVLKFLSAQRKVSREPKGFNLAKGYTPDLASVHQVLQKVYRYFSSAGSTYVEKEGLFRVNANVNESKRLAQSLLTNNEFLNDFEDSILVAHALKTALSNAPPILPPAFQLILIEVSKHIVKAPSSNGSVCATPESVETVLALAQPKLFELPHLNMQCLHILLYLLRLVSSQQSTNKMGAQNLSTIFTFLLFPELLVPNPGLQELVAILIERCNQVFPHAPVLKISAAAGRKASDHSDMEMSTFSPSLALPGLAAAPLPSDASSSSASSSNAPPIPASSSMSEPEPSQTVMEGPTTTIVPGRPVPPHIRNTLNLDDLPSEASEVSVSTFRRSMSIKEDAQATLQTMPPPQSPPPIPPVVVSHAEESNMEEHDQNTQVESEVAVETAGLGPLVKRRASGAPLMPPPPAPFPSESPQDPSHVSSLLPTKSPSQQLLRPVSCPSMPISAPPAIPSSPNPEHPL